MTKRSPHVGTGGWRRFFGDQPYPFDLDMVASREDTVSEVQFVARQLAARCTILDAGCGWGRHAGYLAEAGHRVVGLDALMQNARVTSERYPSVSAVAATVANLPFGNASFDSALSLYTSLGYDEPIAVSLRELRRCVKLDGLLIWDMSLQGAPYLGIERIPDGVGLYGGLTSHARRWHWSVAVHLHRMQLFSLNWQALKAVELPAVLRATGWRLESAFADYHGAPLHRRSKRAIVVARAC